MSSTENTCPTIESHALFSTPIWQTRAPEFEPYAESIERWVMYEWQQGSFEKHVYGYGYQSPPRLFSPEVLGSSEGLKALRSAFLDRVKTILRQRVNQATQHPPEIYAVQAWILIQTSEEWVNGTWHDHFPATLSGCYYLRVPETADHREGALAFQRPGSPDPFTRQIQQIRPSSGDFIIFPSHLLHRPQPCPSAKGLRISINMDAYVHWRHWNEFDHPLADSQEWRKQVLGSLDSPTAHPGWVGRESVDEG